MSEAVRVTRMDDGDFGSERRVRGRAGQEWDDAVAAVEAFWASVLEGELAKCP